MATKKPRTKAKAVQVWCQFCELTNMSVLVAENECKKKRVATSPCPLCHQKCLKVINHLKKNRRAK